MAPNTLRILVQISGSVFVVTGGGSGIGRDVVLELLRRGATVAAVDLRAQGLAVTVARAALTGSAEERLTTHTVDVSDRAAVEALADDVLAAHGRVDGVANVAGVIQPFVPFADLERADMEKVVAVNFWGVVNVCEAFLPHLRSRPSASLLNVASMGAFVPVPGQSIYGASKAAVKLLTEGLYAELRGSGVAVTLVFPGAVGTDIATNSGATIPGRNAADSDIAGRMTTSADAAAQVVDAIDAGTFRVRIGKDAKMLDLLSRVAPRRAIELVAKKMASLVS